MIKFFTRHQLQLDRIGSICTDGVQAMPGNRSGFAALIRTENPNLKITHCFFHQYTLAASKLAPDLKKTLEVWVKVVNRIRSNALNHRLFQSFCKKVGQEHCAFVLYQSIVAMCYLICLNWEKKFSSFFGQVQELAGYFGEPEFVHMLAYLADVFTALNELNLTPFQTEFGWR